MNEIPKDIMEEIVSMRKKNIDLHEKYCKLIVEGENFKSWQDWEKQRTIDILSGVQFGEDVGIMGGNLQMSNKDEIENIFKEHGTSHDFKRSL